MSLTGTGLKHFIPLGNENWEDYLYRHTYLTFNISIGEFIFIYFFLNCVMKILQSNSGNGVLNDSMVIKMKKGNWIILESQEFISFQINTLII